MLAKATARTKIVYLANPNNPTGTYIPFSEVKRLHAGLPPHALLVIDAAYAEYVTRNDYAAGLELASTAENVVMTRTFSKIHGLADLRIGWAYGSAHVLDALNRVRGPFNLNGAAQAAGVASLDDVAHIEGAIAHNSRWLPWLAEAIAELGIEVTPSVGNFLLLTFPKEPARPHRVGRRRLLERARLHPAGGRGLRAAGLAAADGRRRGGQPAASSPRSPNSCGAGWSERLGAPLAEPIFDELAIIGVGLIGSSIARAARRRNAARRIVLADHSGAVLERAKALALGDVVTDDLARAVERRRLRHSLRAGRGLRGGRTRHRAGAEAGDRSSRTSGRSKAR